ncbi:hypothetical protein OAO87_04320 [bacterium]|nr:hypothetical protein [bacterium]
MAATAHFISHARGRRIVLGSLWPRCRPIVYGCMVPTALNYDESATIQRDDDCTHAYYGCTDPNADNFNAIANVDSGLCSYPICTWRQIQHGT